MILAAPPEERPVEGPKPSILAATGGLTFLLVICFLLHAALFGLFIYFDGSGALAPAEQEIPVEVVIEQPPPKEPEPTPPKSEKPPEEKPPEQKPLDEKPATDAPRASKDDKFSLDAPDKETHAPKPAEDAELAKPKPASDPAQTAEKTTEAKAAEASAPKLKEDRPDGEPINTAEAPKPEAPEQTKAEQAAPQPVKQPSDSEKTPPTFAAMPDYSFAPASRQSTIAGGNAASTYLSNVYGLVASHMRMPKIANGRADMMGEIAFDVDFAGSLISVRVIKKSGSPELDAAAMAAIRAAAPFPLPPTGSGVSMRLHYSGN